MYSRLFVVEPSCDCPFRVEVTCFTPSRSYEDGLTLLFFHGVNLHKETYAVLISYLLDDSSPVRIKDVWSIDNPNHGRSAALNRDLLDSAEYQAKWSVMEYTRAAQALLTTTSHGVDFTRRKIVGIAHSAGATSLMLLRKMQPQITFESLILMDPGILPLDRPSSAKLKSLFVEIALARRDHWPSIEEARRDLSQNASFRSFHPSTFESFLECALRRADPTGGITFSYSKLQELAYYASDDFVGPPAEVLISLSNEDRLPVHLIVGRKDAYRGMGEDTKAFLIDTIRKMTCGSIQVIEKGGHMFPQVEPELTAAHIRNALLKVQNRNRVRL